jgi:hypothetical protein
MLPFLRGKIDTLNNDEIRPFALPITKLQL